MKKSCFALLAVLVCLSVQLAGTSFAASFLTPHENQWLQENRHSLEILFGYEAPPNAFHDDDGEYVGLLVDFQKELERTLNVPFKFRSFATWNDLMEYSKTGSNFVVVGIAYSTPRSMYLNFTAPFIKIPYVIVTRSSAALKNMEALAGKKVCTVANYAVNDYIAEHHPQIVPTGVPDNLAGLRAVATGQFDAMIINQAYATYLIEQQGLTNLVIAGESGYLNRLSVATAKQDVLLNNIMDKALDNISPQVRKEIIRKWVTGSVPTLPEYALTAIIAGILIVLVVLLAFWVWVRTLRFALQTKTTELAYSEKRYRTLFDTSSDAAFVHRFTFGNGFVPFEDVNPRACEVLGYTRQELLTMTPDDLNFSRLSQKQKDRIRAELVEDGRTVFDIQLPTKRGALIPVEMSSSLFNLDGTYYALSFARDLTDRNRAESRMLMAKKAAENASRTKSRFLANMSHEIRTPLNGISGMLQLLQDTPLNSTQSEYIDNAMESSRRLTRLLSDILDLSRVEAGKLEIASEPFDLRDTIKSVEQLFTPSAQQKSLILTFSVDPELPEVLRGDSTRLVQLMSNFIGNAIKYSDTGGIDVSFAKLPIHKEGMCNLLITVEDTGIGIPDDKIAVLFDDFTQLAEGYTRKYQGVGLGLSISKRLVKLMKGNLALESVKGAGTTVYLGLSMPVADKSEIAHAQPVQQVEFTCTKVLLVDDDRIARLSASRMLAKICKQVEIASNGQEALEFLKQDDFDMIFMDVQMPVLDGVAATRAIRNGDAGEKNRSIPIIALTAYAMVGDKEKMLDAGMDGYLTKPMEFAELKNALSRYAPEKE